MDPIEDEKRAAAQAAAAEVADGMRLGLGTGSTVAHFLAALAARRLRLQCVATSPATEESAKALGIPVEPFDLVDRLDLAVDGADQVSAERWLVKGGGGAHAREKVAAAAADRFLVIVSSDKLVDRLGPPVPLEVLRYGLRATVRRLGELGPVTVREAPFTPDGNVIVDYRGPVGDPGELEAALASEPGVLSHGLFPPRMVSEILVGGSDGGVRRIPGGTPSG